MMVVKPVPSLKRPERSATSTVFFEIPTPSLTLRTPPASPNGAAAFEIPDQYS